MTKCVTRKGGGTAVKRLGVVKEVLEVVSIDKLNPFSPSSDI